MSSEVNVVQQPRRGLGESDPPCAEFDLAVHEDSVEDDGVSNLKGPGLVGSWTPPAFLVDRFAGAERMQDLRRIHFEGSLWKLTSDDLSRYSYRKLVPLIRSRQVFRRSFDLGRPVTPISGEIDADDRAGLIHFMITDALPRFWKDERVGAGWRPTGKVALGEYFLNGCILCFKGPYERWKTQVRHWDSVSLHDPMSDAHLFESPPNAGHASAEVNIEYDELAAGPSEEYRLDVVERQILFLVDQKYSRKYIAELLNFANERAVGRAIEKIRKKRDLGKAVLDV